MKFIKRKLTVVVILVLSVLNLNNCAAIFKGTNDSINFKSKPAGAKVYLNGEYAGDTPLHIKLKASKSYIVEIKKDGYNSCTYHLNSEISAGWIILDVICGLVPVAIDAVTGSWYYLEPGYLNCDMEKNRI